MPFGFRREMAGVRYAQLNLVRERKLLQEQELELSHQLADAVRDLSQNYMLSQTNYNRWLAARREVEAVNASYKAGTTTLDQVLDAQRRQAEAENEYYRTLVDYTLSITMVHFRKGSLLEYDGVYLAEGPWPAKAYFDARRRARHRDASHFIDYGFTQPRIISQGPYEQGAGQMASDGEMPAEAPMPVGQPGPIGPGQIDPLQPVPMDQAPTTGGNPQLKGEDSVSARKPRAGRIVPTAKVGQNKGSAGRGYDLATMNLGELNAPIAPLPAATARNAEQVQATSYQQAGEAPATEGATKPSAVWKSTTRSGKTNEPVANPSPAPSNPSASGWKNVQHGSSRSEL
jgi:hypothetical protein